MINPKLLLALLFGSVLAACTDTTKDRPGPEIPELPPFPSQITILNTPLPIHETFGAGGVITGPEGGIEFFSPTYKALATPALHENIADRLGNLYDLEDTLPSFYYPTCCFFQTDPPGGSGTQLRDPPVYVTDMDFRLKVADGKMAISNGRFSIGQVLSDLTPGGVVDRKSSTTEGAIASLGSWGELDLSQPYRVSFCLAATGTVPPGTGSNVEVFVDNNSSGNQDHSIHVNASMLLRTNTTGGQVNSQLVPGNRLVLELPGQVRQINNAGEQVGNSLGILPVRIGTPNSFLQLRVSSGGYAVISDLVIEYQSDRTVEQLVADLPCDPDPNFFDVPLLRDIRESENLPGGAQFAGLPLAVNANIIEKEFFGQVAGWNQATETTDGNYLTISDDQFDSFYKETGSPTRVFVDTDNNAVRFGDARWAIGLKDGNQDNCTTINAPNPAYPCPTGTPNGDIDLSQPYRIKAQILSLPAAAGTFRVNVDNSTVNAANSIHGAASRLINNLTFDGGLNATGELIINVPGLITLNGTQIGTLQVPNHVGTATSFIAFECPSNCGQANATSGGISLGNIVIEYQ